jgi:ParB-like chromosome segregation protein Spo0J
VSGSGEPGRLELLPAAVPEAREATLRLDQLTGFEHAHPNRKLTELIRRLGVLEPIIVTPEPRGGYRIVEGRRRAKAVQLLSAENPEAAIAAVIVTGAGSERSAVLAGLALALHAGRSDSPASELEAIEAILHADGASGEASTISRIAAETGMSAQTIRRRLRLRRLSPALRASFEQGEITTSVAEAAARLSPEQQAQLEHALADGGQVTLAAVRKVARARTSEAALTLPDELFTEPTTSWQLNVRGHLQAALEAIPADQRDSSPLAEAISAALKAAERPDHAAAETPARTQRAR